MCFRSECRAVEHVAARQVGDCRTPELDQFLDSRVESGLCESASEVIGMAC